MMSPLSLLRVGFVSAALVLLGACADTGTFFFDTGTVDASSDDAGGGGGDADATDSTDTELGDADSTDTDPGDTGPADTGPGDTDPTLDDAAPADTDPGPDAGGEPDTGEDREAAVCQRWSRLRADLTEGDWSGDARTCSAGDMSDAWRDRVLESINTHRFIAGLPPVTRDPERDRIAQECALLMHANGGLSHSPPESWACYSGDGARGAGASNLAQSAAMAAMDLYMVDFGNDTTFGHRRWFLSNSLGPVGIGSTSGFSCHYVLGGSGSHDAEWVAWPPPGPVPIEAMDPIRVFRGPSVDEIGWTVQSDTIRLNDATVTVRNRGEDRPVEVWSLLPRYGSQSAIAFRPVGWTSAVDETYDVTVTAGERVIEWSVRFVDCGG